MILRSNLIELFKKASTENDILLKENIILRWVHRFGIDSLNDLLIHSPALKEYPHEEESQEQITSIGEVDEENQKQINLELSKTIENKEETVRESEGVKNPNSTGIFSKNQNSNNIKQSTNTQNLPLPNLENLRKWINDDKKAS